MENFCKGVTFGLISGMVIAGVIVAKNKKLAGKIRDFAGVAEEKLQEAKEFVEEKIEESKCDCGSNSSCSEQSNLKNDCKDTSDCKDLNKKSKNY